MKNHQLKKLTDKLAEYIITVAGVAVIAAMFVMLALIVREAAPLFLPSGEREIGSSALPRDVAAEEVVALGVDGDLRGTTRAAGLILRDGRGGFSVLNGSGASAFAFSRLPGAPADAAIRSVQRHGNRLFTVLWENGEAALYSLSVSFTYENNGEAAAAPSFVRVFAVDPGASEAEAPLPLFALLDGEAAKARRSVLVHADGTVAERSSAPAKGILNRGRTVESEQSVALDPRFAGAGALTAAALNEDGRLYLGTAEGSIVSVNFAASGGQPAVEVTPAFRDRRAITSLSFLRGGAAIAVGDATGAVSVWFPRREEGAFRLRQSVGWDAGGGGAVAIAASWRWTGTAAYAGSTRRTGGNCSPCLRSARARSRWL